MNIRTITDMLNLPPPCWAKRNCLVHSRNDQSRCRQANHAAAIEIGTNVACYARVNCGKAHRETTSRHRMRYWWQKFPTGSWSRYFA